MIEFSLVKYPELGDRFSQNGAHFNLITSSIQLSMPGLCAHTVMTLDKRRENVSPWVTMKPETNQPVLMIQGLTGENIYYLESKHTLLPHIETVDAD